MKDTLEFTFTYHGQPIHARLESVAGGGTHALFHLAELREGKWYHCGQLFYAKDFDEWRYAGNRYEDYGDYFAGVLLGWYQ